MIGDWWLIIEMEMEVIIYRYSIKNASTNKMKMNKCINNTRMRDWLSRNNEEMSNEWWKNKSMSIPGTFDKEIRALATNENIMRGRKE